MRLLSFAVALIALAAFAVFWRFNVMSAGLLAAFCAACAYTTFRSSSISTFLRIFVATFSTEAVIFGGASLLSISGVWPSALEEYRLPDSVALTVAMFSILVWAVSHLRAVRAIAAISDHYFNSTDRTRARVWPLPAFQTSERALGVAMVVCLVLINQAQVGIMVRLSFFNRDWFNAIQNKDQASFWSLLFSVFLVWAVIYIASAIVEIVLTAMLTIRWRRSLTTYFLGRWLDGATHYRMSLEHARADNPDQRIAEDVNRFIDGGSVGYGVYSYSILLISTLSSLVSFAVILWMLSADFTIPGTTIAVPGFLFWVAIIYAAIGTAATHLIGRPLSRLLFLRQRYEADFRFQLARLREYSEQVALLKGERAERNGAMGRFSSIYENFVDTMRVRKRLTAFTATYGQISPFIPYIVAAPFYFAGKIQLGVMSQTAGAFGRVEGALNFFVNYYSSLADFKAVLDRLIGFDASIDKARALQHITPIAAHASEGDAISADDLAISLADGRTILGRSSFELPAHQATLVTGPSGAGKSTLFRAVAGLWPHGAGALSTPVGKRVMLLPQKPYIPIGTLRAAVAYPAAPDHYSDDALRAALETARLPTLVGRLDEEDNWTMRLSGGEQQRLAVARALLAKPDWLFLDEATAALDEDSEASLYHAFADHLPDTTIVSIGHRSTLAAFHQRRLSLKPDGAGAFTIVADEAMKIA